MTLFRYRGRGTVFLYRRIALTVFGCCLVFWQFSNNGPSAILLGFTLAALASALRTWRSWPYLRIAHEDQATVLFARNWISVRDFRVDERSTIYIYTSSWNGERIRTFRVVSKALDFSSRVKLSGEKGFAESETLAEAWRRAGGTVKMERKMRW